MSRRCLILARVSTKEKGQDATTQVDMLRAAIARQGWVESCPPLVMQVSAWDEKASLEVREAVVKVIQEGKADTLVVWKLDRILRRGIAPMLAFFDLMEKHLGASIYSLQEPMLSTATMSPAMREWMVGTFAYLARQESDDKSARVNLKKESKRNRAAALGQRATWGRGTMATPAEEERVVELARAGQSVRGIAAATGVSKSQVSRITTRRRKDIEAVPVVPPGQDGGAGDGPAPSSGGGLGQPAWRGEPDRPGDIRHVGAAPVTGPVLAADRDGRGVGELPPGHANDGGEVHDVDFPVNAVAAVLPPIPQGVPVVAVDHGAAPGAVARPDVGHDLSTTLPRLKPRVGKRVGFPTPVNADGINLQNNSKVSREGPMQTESNATGYTGTRMGYKSPGGGNP